jgi:glutamyl-tRNA synthetase/glutamyl-Q tRNA(Asp) synthetase
LRIVTRFAPAPTGYLHLGHVVNALHVWGAARERGAHVILRLEDHDRTRCRAAYADAIIEDLAWLGFVPDSVAPRQSERGERYEAALAALDAAGLTYACDCSRRDIAMDVPDRFGEETRYPGRCRTRGLPPSATPARRVRMDDGVESFDDIRLGPQRQSPAEQCGDLLVRDRLGNWTYQFAVVVDDMDQGVNLVIRGEDLLSSTGRQIRLGRLLGREAPPLFLHHALLRNADGTKLSKSAGDTAVRELRASGKSANEVLALASALAAVHS